MICLLTPTLRQLVFKQKNIAPRGKFRLVENGLKVQFDSQNSDVKQQKLIECVLTGNSKQYLGKSYTEEQVNKLSAEEVDKLFNNYEAKLSGKVSW